MVDDLYAVSILSFVQLILLTVLVLSPAREIGGRFSWTGSRITEVMANTVGAVVVTAASCVLTHVLWGLPLGSLESAAYPLVVLSIIVIVLQPDRNIFGQLFYAAFAAASVSWVVWSGYITFVAPSSILETLTASFVLLLSLGAFIVWMSMINYQSDVLTRSRRERPLPKADPSYQPMVSLHIPAYNEPPELLIETIKAAERIDYPDFEIIVMDNNTQDPAVWGPVEEYCRDRPRVKFVHVAPWPGYKAGACNLALREYTDPRAEIIGLIDADDLVQPYSLRETVSYFSHPNIGIVQTNEGNRDFEGSSYYTACVDSYQAFYLSVMSSRNERDTVPFVGTMGLFRRSALTSVGGWNEWCICEDTEASLRVLKEGWSGLYIPRCFGRGVVPPDWAGMLTQRHRWCFGAMQILRLHWRSLMPWDRSPDNHMTGAQRRDYLMASLGWFRDFLMLAFSVLLLVISALTVSGSDFAVAPLYGSRSLLPLSLIVIATILMMFTLRHWTTLTYRRALLSLVISLAVTLVIARGCIEGVARKDGVFLRTSKAGGRRTILTAVKLTRWETAISVALFVAGAFLVGWGQAPWLLVFLVFAQATFYLCGPIAAVWNLRAREHSERDEYAEAGRRSKRTRFLWPRPAVAVLGALCVAGAATAFVVPPAPLLHAAPGSPGAPWPQTLLASAGTNVYFKVGSRETPAGRAYHPITLLHLSGAESSSAVAGLTFATSSPVLLDELLRALADDGQISYISIAFRTTGPAGRPVTRQIDTFATAVVTSVVEPTSDTHNGSVSLLLPAASAVTSAPDTLRHAGPFVRLSPAPPTTRASVALGPDSPSYPVKALSLSRAGPDAPLDLGFTTTAPALLTQIFRAQGASAAIPALTLSVRHGPAGQPVRSTFSELNVNSFSESFTAPISGTTSLSVPVSSK